jgi:replicative DNA helicase
LAPKPDRLPPHDELIEESVLGAMLLGDRDSILEVTETHPRLPLYFYSIRSQTIFSAIAALVEGREPVSVISVKALLEKRQALENAGGLDYLARLPDKAPTAGSAAYYAGQLHELFIKRQAIAACAKIEALAYNGATEAELLETLERELNAISSENAPNETNIKTLVQSAIDHIEAAFQNKGRLMGLSTGFTDLDHLTHGLRPGQLIVIGAATSMGKTTLATNIAEHVAVECKQPVGFIELEMTADELLMRMISSRSGVPMDRMISGELLEGDFQTMGVAASSIANAPLHIADEGGITIGQLKAKARRMHRRYKLFLLVIDYLQLIKPSRSNASRNVEITEISNSLKALAKELSVPVIVPSQLNRESDRDNREPRLRDLRDSGSIEQDADIVGLLHQPDEKSNLIVLNIAKHRQGPKRKLKLVFLKDTLRFRPAP